eukprot:513018_1
MSRSPKPPKQEPEMRLRLLNKHNLTDDANQSFYDSEATESEDDPFPSNKILKHDDTNTQMNQDIFHSQNQSLKLTEENIIKHNLSSSSCSSSSVLSKHNFGLLEISCSDEDNRYHSEPKTITKRAKPMGAMIDLCSSVEEEEEAIIKPKHNAFNDQWIQNENKKIICRPTNTSKHTNKVLKPVHMNSTDGVLCNRSLTQKQFKKERDQYTLHFLHQLNDNAFDSKLKLNQNLTYSWCNTLNKTAGDCRLITRNKTRKAHIRLATKVLDTLEKLKQTLCHEMCHAMAWIVDASRKPPHGNHFKYWGSKAQLAFR